ncbi:MAG TPA: branched-chain amino acid ABC transporter permease [Anaerolineae bacterium]
MPVTQALFASLADGLLLGFVYGLAAMGLTLIFGVIGVVNLSHGALMTVGMFAAFLLFSALHLHPYLALPLLAVSGALLGGLLYSAAIHPILEAPPLSSLLSTFAINMIIIGAGTAVFTSTPRNIDVTLGAVQAGSVQVLGTRLVAALASVLFTAGLYLFLYRTRTGKSIRAVANNRIAAELVGLASTRYLAMSFGLGSLLAVVSGGLIATLFPFTIFTGASYQLKSFVIAVLGGLGNPTGALVGGLVLGLIEGVIPMVLPVGWTPVIEFSVFVLMILVRPGGLLGGRR